MKLSATGALAIIREWLETEGERLSDIADMSLVTLDGLYDLNRLAAMIAISRPKRKYDADRAETSVRPETEKRTEPKVTGAPQTKGE